MLRFFTGFFFVFVVFYLLIGSTIPSIFNKQVKKQNLLDNRHAGAAFSKASNGICSHPVQPLPRKMVGSSSAPGARGTSNNSLSKNLNQEPKKQSLVTLSCINFLREGTQQKEGGQKGGEWKGKKK